MTSSFEIAFQEELAFFHQFLQTWIEKYQKNVPSKNNQLIEALKYALKGGKRFRPLLVILTTKSFKQDVKCVLPYACSVEFLHTYSLIHDDLPAMDNAEKRRGRLSLHKAFNEAIAILTGDALLTEAFGLAVSYKPKFLKDTSSLVQLLVQAAGGQGMISGQMIDLQAIHDGQSIDLEQLYDLKTGALISSSVMGAAVLSEVQEPTVLKLKDFAQKLGIAFQIADDLEDFEEQSDGKLNIINCAHQWGLKTAREKLYALYQEALGILKSIENTENLQNLMQLHFKKHL